LKNIKYKDSQNSSDKNADGYTLAALNK